LTLHHPQALLCCWQPRKSWDSERHAIHEGVCQVASFHPDYRFTDAPDDDPANFTNRSVYPMLHLQREESLEKAIESHPDPEGIPTGMWHSQGRRAWHICKGSGMPACEQYRSLSLAFILSFSSCSDMQLTSAISGPRRQQYGNPPVDGYRLPVTVIHIGLRECVQGYQQREYDHYLFHLVFFSAQRNKLKGLAGKGLRAIPRPSFPAMNLPNPPSGEGFP
jgi:hypothetical protein